MTALRIAHLSDLHFGEDVPLGLAERLAEEVRAARPDVVAVSGDLTRNAQPDQFRAAGGFLRALGAPVVAVPGNHDIPHDDLWDRFARPRARWAAAFKPAWPEVVELAGWALVGLDTTRRMHWRHLDWSAGGVTRARREALRTRLRAQRGAGRRVVLVAHHPLAHPEDARGRAAPHRAEQTLALLREEGVEAVLCGHLHRGVVLGERPALVLAASALSPRLKGEPNGWNLVELGEGGVRVDRRVLAANQLQGESRRTGGKGVR